MKTHTRATQHDWGTNSFPTARASLCLVSTYTIDEFNRIKKGIIPQSSDDKWFVYFEEPWLYVHRSWTGYGIYLVRFQTTDGGAHIVEGFVSRDPEQYRGYRSEKLESQYLKMFINNLAGRDTEREWQQFLAAEVASNSRR